MFIASLLASQTENKFVTFGLMFMKLTDIFIASFYGCLRQIFSR